MKRPAFELPVGTLVHTHDPLAPPAVVLECDEFSPAELVPYFKARRPGANGIISGQDGSDMYFVAHEGGEAVYRFQEFEVVLPVPPPVSKKSKLWANWPELYRRMEAMFKVGASWTVGGGQYWIQRKGTDLFFPNWKPPPEAVNSEGKPIEGYEGKGYEEWSDAVRVQVNDFWTRWHEGLGYDSSRGVRTKPIDDGRFRD